MKALVTSIAFSSLLLFSSFDYNNISESVAEPTDNASIETLEAIADDQIATFTMEFQEYKKGKPTKNSGTKITYYLNGDKIAFKPEMDGGQSTLMIFDSETKTMTTLLDRDGEKSGMTMKMPKVMLNDDSKNDDDLDFKVTPTNESKKILGYECKKILIESKDYTGHAWITDEVDLKLEKAFNFVDAQKKSKNTVHTFGDIKGFPLETLTKNKKKDESYEMKVTDLKLGSVDESVFNTAGYNITDMSNFMNMGGE